LRIDRFQEQNSMARIPEAQVQRLKDEVAVQRLIEEAGIELKRVGKDLAGRTACTALRAVPDLWLNPIPLWWRGCASGPSQ
jgi:hypothetical protein